MKLLGQLWITFVMVLTLCSMAFASYKMEMNKNLLHTGLVVLFFLLTILAIVAMDSGKKKRR